MMKHGFASVAVVLGVALLGFGGLFAVPGVAHADVSVDIKANGQDGPISITSGSTVTLSWTSTGGDTCTVNPGGYTGTNNSTTVTPGTSQTYILVCTGPNATAGSDMVTVNVNSAPTPTTDIKANGQDGPITIQSGQTVSLSWTSQNATQCTVNPGALSGLQNSGTTVGPLTATQTYVVVCTGPNATAASDMVTVNVQQVSLPPTADIKANGSDGPVSVAYNTPVFLSWTSQNVTQCTVSPGGFTGTTGSQATANLLATQTYTLNCTGPNGPANDTVTVNVGSPPQITVDIKANASDGPITIPSNTAAILSWTSRHATQCTVSPGGFTGTNSSQSTGNLTASRTYTINCTGPSGSASDTVTVNVSVTPQITADIKANNQDSPITIAYNTSAIISWTSSGAQNCTVFPGGFTGTTGSQSTGNLIATQTYTLTCSNGSQSVNDTVTVNVDNQQNPPTVTIVANPASIQQGQSSVLTWNSQNATQCTAAGSWSGAKSLSGSESVSPMFTSNYVIICTNSVTGLSANAQATVTVTAPGNTQSPTLTLYASPTSITQGQSATLVWNSFNTVTCYATTGTWSGTKSLSGSEQVYPTVTTTYGMTCNGTNGQPISAQATVVVTQNQQQILPTVTLTALPSSITQGQNTSLSWYSTNANTCNVSGGWSGSRNTSGNEIATPFYTTTYTITCLNNFGLASAQATAVVNSQYIPPYNPPVSGTSIIVTKSVRNVTLGQSGFSQAVDADTSDRLEFEIRVRNADASQMTVTLRDILPQELYIVPGSVTVDGAYTGDGILTGGGITLNTLYQGQERVIRFQTTVFAGAGSRSVVNQAIATTGSGTVRSGFANVNIRPRGAVLGVADVVTGPEDVMPIALGLGLLATLLFHFTYLRGVTAPVGATTAVRMPLPVVAQAEEYGSELKRRIMGEAKKSAATTERNPYSASKELEKLIHKIKTSEDKPDTDSFA